MQEIQELLINESLTLKDTLSKLDKTGKGVLLITDCDGKLIRTVTDGDLRRLILDEHPVDVEISVLPARSPRVITTKATPQDAYIMMQKFSLDQIPVIDEDGYPQHIIYRRDISDSVLLSIPHLGEEEKKYVAEAFSTNWIAPFGPNLDAFENELAEHVGVKAAAATSSGTAAIHLAMVLLDVQPDDIVFCSSFTFVASVNPIIYQGAKPVLIDSEKESWNMSPQALKRAFEDAESNSKLPKVVIVVNLYGQSADMKPIIEICDHYGVPVVEDAAESLGATYKGKASGTFGKLGIYSFNGNKIITTSGGGMLVSDDEELIEKARFMANQAREPGPFYQHNHIGYNYRMSNVLAGIGRGQLKVLTERVAARRQIYANYAQAFSVCNAIEMMPEASFGSSTHWLSVMLLRPEKIKLSTKQLIDGLARHNIEARHTWKPMHLQPIFQDVAYYKHDESGSVSDYLFEQGICLPSSSCMQPDAQQRVIDSVLEIINRELAY